MSLLHWAASTEAAELVAKSSLSLPRVTCVVCPILLQNQERDMSYQSVILWAFAAAPAVAASFSTSAALAQGRADRPADVVPLPRAHAHNDYLHRRPLADALDHGFMSVEADIFLVDGELLVAHTLAETAPHRTLERLYLVPLRDRVLANQGGVYPTLDDGQPRPFQLLIDIKSEAVPTYKALSQILGRYADILTVVRAGVVQRGAIDVVVSGNRPVDLMRTESIRYAGIDGRLSDLDSDLPPHLMPLISDRWGAHFKWRGDGPLDASEQMKLDQVIATAHSAGRRIRFWATPESEASWRLLNAVGVDHINTDDLPGLRAILSGE